MFSASEYQYVKDLTLAFYNESYQYYVCYTNNPTDYYNTQYYDVYCYYSKSKIAQKNQVFSFSKETKKCLIDTKSRSNNYKTNTLVCLDNTDSSITVDSKEFIYSNVGYNSDIISDYTSTNNRFNNFDLLLLSILIILILTFLYSYIKQFLRR